MNRDQMKNGMTSVIGACATALALAGAGSAFAGFVNEVPQPQRVAAQEVKPFSDSTAAEVPSASAPAASVPASQISKDPLAGASRELHGGVLTEIGKRPTTVSAPKGRGIDVALSDVMPVISGRNFRVEFGTVEPYRTVSWTGGKAWDGILKDVIHQLPGVDATIDWDKRLVTLSRDGKAVGGLAAVSSRAQRGEGARSSIGAVPLRWDVRATDVTLRQALIRWAKTAGWQVSWEIAYDYPVQLEGTFGGTFEDAVEKWASSLRYSDYPALACMYEDNRVVRVLHYGDKKQCDK